MQPVPASNFYYNVQKSLPQVSKLGELCSQRGVESLREMHTLHYSNRVTNRTFKENVIPIDTRLVGIIHKTNEQLCIERVHFLQRSNHEINRHIQSLPDNYRPFFYDVFNAAVNHFKCDPDYSDLLLRCESKFQNKNTPIESSDFLKTIVYNTLIHQSRL